MDVRSVLLLVHFVFAFDAGNDIELKVQGIVLIAWASSAIWRRSKLNGD